jgi:hypothetical protein
MSAAKCGHGESGVHDADPLLLVRHDRESGLNALPIQLR